MRYLKADPQQSDPSDIIGFPPPKVHPALLSRWHYFLAHRWASIVGTAHFNPWFRGTDRFIDLLIEFPEHASSVGCSRNGVVRVHESPPGVRPRTGRTPVSIPEPGSGALVHPCRALIKLIRAVLGRASRARPGGPDAIEVVGSQGEAEQHRRLDKTLEALAVPGVKRVDDGEE